MSAGQVGRLLRVHLTVPLWLGLLLGAGLLIGLYFAFPENQEHIKFVTAVIAAAVAIYSVYYAGAGLKLKIERDRQHSSFELIQLLNRPEYVQVRNFVDQTVDGLERISDGELYKKICDDAKLDDAVTATLGILEDASLAVQFQYADEDVLYHSLFTIVDRLSRGLRGYIEQLRKTRGSSAYFAEFEKLARAWSGLRRLSDGGPIRRLAQ